MMSLLPFTLSVLLSGLASSSGTTTAPTGEKAQATARDRLSTQLDILVSEAEKKAKAQLPEKVTSAKQALKHAQGVDRAKNYRVLEHKGWWIVAWYGSGSEPHLWFYGVAIRKDSKDIYHFGAW